MSRLLLFPYRRLAEDAVEASSWLMDGGALEGYIKDATYDSTPEVEWRGTVQAEALRQCLGGSEYAVDVLLGARAVESGVQRVLARAELPRDGGAIALKSRLTLAELSETIELTVKILVVSCKAPAGDPGAPTEPGAVLWSTATTVRAFGIGSQFPVAVTDLRYFGLPEDALWYLEMTQSDPESSFMGAVRLHISAKHQYIVPLLMGEGAKASTQVSVSVLHLKLDLLRHMLRLAAKWSRDGVTPKSLPQDSLGAACFGVMQQVRLRSGLGSSVIVDEVLDRPEYMESILQAILVGGLA